MDYPYEYQARRRFQNEERDIEISGDAGAGERFNDAIAVLEQLAMIWFLPEWTPDVRGGLAEVWCRHPSLR